MNIQQDATTSEFNIQRYRPGEIWVNRQSYQRSILICPKLFNDHWTPQIFSELQPHHFQNILDATPEIFILGTGAKLHFPPTEWLLPFYEKGIGIEIMDSLHTVYTYNILCSENRDVTAGILIQ